MSVDGLSYLKPFVPVSGRHYEVEEVLDELFLDLHDGVGTQFLAGTCYGVAVEDSTRVGEDHYILEVRPQMRALLYMQLQKHYRVFKLHRFSGDPDSRMILTAHLCIRFATHGTRAERLACLEIYFPHLGVEDDLEDGIYTLRGKLGEDPLFVWKDLELEGSILQASPVCLAVPSRLPDARQVDLLAAT